MLFTEPAFLFCFLPILIGLYFASFRAWRNALLLAASILFYAKGGGRFTYLLAASVVFNYSMAIWIHRLDRSRLARALLAFAVGANLLVLGIFKYATFFVETVNVVRDRLSAGLLRRAPSAFFRSGSRSSPFTRFRTS